MSTLVFVDPEISTQADGAQSPQVPVPSPEDPYEAIRQAYLVETDTKSEPFKDPVETETPELPHTVASPTSLPDSTPPTRQAEESKDSDTSGVRSTTARMAVRIPPAMSLSLSASIVEVPAMSDSSFRKRFRSSYESSPSSSPLDLPSWKRSRGTSELVEDDEEEDEEEEEESSDSNSESEDTEDEGPTAEDEGPAARDEGLVAGDEVLPLGLGYGAFRHREIASRKGQMPSVFEDGRAYIDVPAYPLPAPPVQKPPSSKWSSGSLPISLAPSIVPSSISSPMIPLNVLSLVASPATAVTEGFLTELGAQIAKERRARLDLAKIVGSIRRG
ncbi:hypothetical protein Tco_0953762 [Tanacetum coccineum]|uniref:Uncharacterized protein n=1 Tax=Tanacetum coccineum TaxID=301880 RepID=A0ABQ5E304_9ASTR